MWLLFLSVHLFHPVLLDFPLPRRLALLQMFVCFYYHWRCCVAGAAAAAVAPPECKVINELPSPDGNSEWLPSEGGALSAPFVLHLGVSASVPPTIFHWQFLGEGVVLRVIAEPYLIRLWCNYGWPGRRPSLTRNDRYLPATTRLRYNLTKGSAFPACRSMVITSYMNVSYGNDGLHWSGISSGTYSRHNNGSNEVAVCFMDISPCVSYLKNSYIAHLGTESFWRRMNLSYVMCLRLKARQLKKFVVFAAHFVWLSLWSLYACFVTGPAESRGIRKQTTASERCSPQGNLRCLALVFSLRRFNYLSKL